MSYVGHLFFENVQNLKKISKTEKKIAKKIWIGRVKLSLLRREYLPLAPSVLGNSVEILHITNGDIS